MIPVARDRPSIPATYGVSAEKSGLLEWPAVHAAIDASDIYWIATSGASGAHLVPLHAGSLDGTVYLSGDPSTRWWRNLSANPSVQIGVNHGGLQVMVRGTANSFTPSTEVWATMNNNIGSKYDWQHGPDPLAMWKVQPSSVIAFDVAEFATSPTRFTFEEAP